MRGRGSMTALGLATLLGVVACGDRSAGAAPGEAGSAPSAANSVEQTAVPPIAPQDRTFREWLAACDNGRDCVAYTGSDAGGWLMVRQAAGADAQPQILAGLSAFAGADTVEGVRLTIDGQPLALVAGPSDTMSYAVPADQVRSVLSRLAAARTLSVGLGETQTVLPTAGASAALLWIDETQGRLETTTALIRRGDRPASAVPAAPALPRVVPAAAVDQGPLAGANNPGEQGDEAGVTLPASIEALDAVRQCRADTSYNEYLQKAVLAARLSPDTELWGVPCDSGAYNARYALYISGPNGANPRKATFPDGSGQVPQVQEGDMVGDGLVNPVFDAGTNTLSHFPRARGIGDCGVMQSWAWTGRGFVLTEERSMGQCWGIVPDLWPTTWRTR